MAALLVMSFELGYFFDYFLVNRMSKLAFAENYNRLGHLVADNFADPDFSQISFFSHLNVPFLKPGPIQRQAAFRL